MPYMTDLARENVMVKRTTLGSLKTSVTDKGVYATFYGCYTTLIDLMVPLDILFEIAFNVLIDFRERPLIELGFDILPREFADFTDFYAIKFY